MIRILKRYDIFKGGSGSGNFGHEGRPGEVGGSGSGGGSFSISGVLNVSMVGMNESESASILSGVESTFDSIYETHPTLAASIKNNPIREISLENVEGISIKYGEGSVSALGNYSHNNQSMRIATKNLGSDDSVNLGGFSVGGENLSGIVRHEVGHHVYGKVLGQKGRLAWEKVYRKTQFKKEVSKYAGTNSSEGFSEAFSVYTSSKYSVGSLPPKAESFFKKYLG